MAEQTCDHPECNNTETLIRMNREWFCPDHIDYGMGRAFGPLHRMLDAAQKAGIGVPPEAEDGEA
jgi:hypothetical protein